MFRSLAHPSLLGMGVAAPPHVFTELCCLGRPAVLAARGA